MAAENRLFEDLSRMASGAFSAVSGVREEVEARMRDQISRVLARLDLVTREEFEAVKAVAARARLEQEALEARLAALESAQEPASAAKPARSKRTEPPPPPDLEPHIA